MMQDITLNMLAGQPGVIKITSVTGYGDDVTLAGAVKIRGESVTFEATSDTLTIPALPPGVWRYAVLINGSTAWRGSLMVEDSPLFEDGGQTVWAGTVSKSDDVLEVTISFGVQGPAGPQGADGASAYDIWLAAGNSGTEEEFLESLKGEPGPQGEPGTPGETGPAPAHEWQGTSLRFENPDGTWGSLVDLQGPQGEAGDFDADPLAIGSGAQAASPGDVALGTLAAATGGESTALGSYSEALGITSTAIGGGEARNVGAISIGYGSIAHNRSVAIGYEAQASWESGLAVGRGASCNAEECTAMGKDAYVQDHGVTVLSAGGEFGSSGIPTQIFIIPAGSELSNNYLSGNAGLGYIVYYSSNGNRVVQSRGVVALESICTQHTDDFLPTGFTNE